MNDRKSMAIGPWSPNAAGNQEYKLRQEIAALTAELARVTAEKQELMKQLVQNTEALAQCRQVKAERDAALQELAETNAAFSEAVHMHQQERAALSALLERVTAEAIAAREWK